jgi:hypothetical protein
MTAQQKPGSITRRLQPGAKPEEIIKAINDLSLEIAFCRTVIQDVGSKLAETNQLIRDTILAPKAG